MRSQRESGTNEKNIVCHTFFVLMLSVSGCEAGIQTEKDNPIPIVDKSYHGTYTIDNNALTLNLSDKTYASVVLDEGAGVTFGSDEFTDWTEHIKGTDPMYLLTY